MDSLLLATNIVKSGETSLAEPYRLGNICLVVLISAATSENVSSVMCAWQKFQISMRIQAV